MADDWAPVEHNPYVTPVDPNLLRRIMHLESGGDPNINTGSYHGLFQLSRSEFKKYGGTGDIYDPEANTRAAVNKISAETAAFRQQYGREPTPTEIYLTHQQGQAGLAAHQANPDAPAWQNMYSTAEGRSRGQSWARQAIWGNIPSDMKSMFPAGVDSISSRQFMDLWQHKVAGTTPTNMPQSAQLSGGTRTDLASSLLPQVVAAISEHGIAGTSLLDVLAKKFVPVSHDPFKA
jgi:Transglycosylase SLT domain